MNFKNNFNNADLNAKLDFNYQQPFMERNGRINLNGPVENNHSADMIQSTLQQNFTNYDDALNGNIKVSNLSRAYFSSQNIRIIQNGIRAGVFKASNGMYNVGYQDETILKIIMRNIFLEYAKHVSNKETEEIKMLNGIVLDYCIKNVYNEAISYVKFKNDLSTLNVPGDLPQYTNSKGDNSLEFKTFF